MERNWELIREIMLKIKELKPRESLRSSHLEGYDSEIVAEHMYLLEQAGLAEINVSRSLSGPAQAIAYRLTWDGHEFIDLMNSDTQWNRVKDGLKERGVEFSFETLKAMAGIVMQNLMT